MNAFKLLIPLGVLGIVGFRVTRTAPLSYDVQLAYVGYLSEFNPLPPPCNQLMDPKGYDSLTGTLSGIEPPAGSDDDAVYTGKVKRKTRIDFCLTKPKSPSAPDELVYCAVHLTGAATMSLELTIESDAGKGAYFKSTPVGPADSVSVRGDCTPQDIAELRADYPGAASAGSPDGQPIAESGTQFTVGGVRRLKVDSFPAKPPETAWGLRVLRAAP